MSQFNFFQFGVPTHIVFGEGVASDFSAELARFAMKRPMLVCDHFLRESGAIGAIRDGLLQSGLHIAGEFFDVAHPASVRIVKELAFEAREQNADSFVVIGGGSVMDVAKAANILLTHGGDLVADYSGAQTIPGPLKPLVAIPTTAGTGSEVTQAAVLYDESQGVKLSFVDDYLRPHLAVLDPLLTLSLPPFLTAATGMDALTHAVEAWTSVQSNPFSDALAKHAIHLVMHHLLPAVIDGDDLDARKGMLTASTMAGVAFDHAMVGVTHAMTHAVEAVAHVHHGTANAILLPWGMTYNRDVCADRYVELASRVGITGKCDVDTIIQQMRQLVVELERKCGLPTRLRDVNVQKDQLPKIASLAAQDGTTVYNPREVDEAEILKLLEQAW
ncbi:MAG: alcohol dehydrogenase [Deltaproteobacteria bacterium CG11_big_fil_rev_8_21_14_0_20_47_16]|nr:MAG: alcohol dehydrogenase [Deltaproteobacteria bacterium CG11_big_fil_rev_8_21_14_0_20_47_16]